MDIDLASKISGFRMGTWAATEVYLDGKHFQSFGQTGANRIGFKEYNPYQKWPTAISVSYTHLDVYKRQNLAPVGVQPDSLLRIRYTAWLRGFVYRMCGRQFRD